MSEDPRLEPAEADRRRDEGLRRMLNTPPQPHKKKGREPKPAPKAEGLSASPEYVAARAAVIAAQAAPTA